MLHISNVCACARDAEGLNGKEDDVFDIGGRTDINLFIKMSYKIRKKFGDYCTIMNLLSEITESSSLLKISLAPPWN